MSSTLSVMEGKLPPGFRFHPRDDELICDYLYAKAAGAAAAGRNSFGRPSIISVDLNKCEPWDLPESACVGEKEWYFFSLRDKKYATGQRTNRATVSGYWKATGKDRPIARDGSLVGSRKTLVFYQGRAPKGKKTEWVMHEFRMEPSPAATCTTTPDKPSSKGDWVLCRAFYKSRGISSKGGKNAETGSDDDTGYNSMLPPPLSDNGSYVSFERQRPLNHGGEALGHVPCFSNHHLMAFPPMLHQLPQQLAVGLLPPVVSSYFSSLSGDKVSSYFSSLSGDKATTVGSILGHLAKHDGAAGVGPNDHTYLSTSATPADPWNHL